MNSLPCMMFPQYHRSKSIRISKAGKMVFSGGVINNYSKALKVTALAVTAVCATTARTIPTVDLV